MKRNAILCLCLCLCMLLSACGTPAPEDSSASAESGETSSVPVIEDENAKTARAYLEELLKTERETGTVDWLTAEQAEAIRDCVKQLKAPILTEADVQGIAECAVAVVSAEKSLSLPACGVLAPVMWSPMVFPELCEVFYTALVSYTLYLFTPPDYLFREDEVSWPSVLSTSRFLYFPLAGAYTSRREALEELQQWKNGVQLPLYGFGEDEHPLDCTRCGAAVLFCGSGEWLSLDLLGVANRGGMTPPKGFFIARAEDYLWEKLNGLIDGMELGVYDNSDLPDGSNVAMYRLLSTEGAREIREQVELLSAPLLTRDCVSALVAALLVASGLDSPLLLLPGVDGKEDMLLPPGVETFEDAMRRDKTVIDAKACEAALYLIDLFTPSACRYTDLLDIEGTYYALNSEESTYLLVKKYGGMYVVDAALTVSPLFITWVPWEE